jgi:PhzF family phenazine biosynthesis protein
MASDVLRYAAFTDDGRGGNPAGVVLDATGMSEDDMLRTAAEVGYSETAFLTPGGEAGRFTTRYFSPLAEVAFCGHATVAAAVALAGAVGTGRILLDTPAGEVAVVTTDGEQVTATLTSVATRTRPATPGQVDAALAALRWDRDDLEPTYPVHVANGGVDHLVLAVAERRRLATLDYDYDALAALMAEEGWTTVHLVHAQDPTTFHARDPFPPGGVVEDPATGAAAAAFGGYLRDLGLVPLPSRVTVLQGADMGAPSRLLVDVSADDRRVRVSGAAAPIVPP